MRLVKKTAKTVVKKDSKMQPVKKKDVKECSVKRTKVKDNDFTTAEYWIDELRPTLAGIPNLPGQVFNKIRNLDDPRQRAYIKGRLLELANLATAAAAALKKSAAGL